MPRPAQEVFTKGVKPPSPEQRRELAKKKGVKLVKAEAYQTGFIHGARIRPGTVVDVSEKFYKENKHWLDETIEVRVAADEKTKAPDGVQNQEVI